MTGPAGAFDHALSTVDGSAAVEVVRQLLDGGTDPLTVLVDVVAAGQRRVGERWLRGEWSVAREHAATSVAVLATEEIARFADRVPVTRGRVLVACAEREWHVLPALIISTAIRLHGWDTVLLGASTSPARLSQYLQDTGPDATAVSCSILGALPTTRRFIEASTGAGVPILVGGSAFGFDDRRALALGATAWAADAHGAVALLDGLPSVVRKAPPLPRQRLAEHSAVELGHHRLLEVLRARWTIGVPAAVRDEALHQALHAVSAALLTGDPRTIPATAWWIDRLLTARGGDSDQVAELGTLLAAAVRDYPEAHALVVRNWHEGLAPEGTRTS